MTQKEFNTEIASLLDDLADHLGLVRSEPKHGIEGHDLRDRIFDLSLKAKEVE